MAKVRTEIRQFVIDNFLFGQDAASLKDDDSFLDGGIVDSTGILQFVGFLEQRFQIQIADDELVPANLDSVTQAADFVERKLAFDLRASVSS